MRSLPLTSLLPLAAAHALPRQGEDTWGTGLPQAREAITTMMTGFYNTTAARWQPEIAWWLSGNALQTLLDYTSLTGDTTYLPQIQQTIDVQSAPLDWWPEGGGYFRADSTDDTGWWALAMTRAYDVTGNETYLDYARLDEEYMRQYWSDSCGGGVIWDIPDLVYKNAISNELYFTLAAAIHNRMPDGDEFYLDRALEGWSWFENSGMINSEGLVNDGLTDDCANNGADTWTYNQGVVLGGLVELYRATKDGKYLATAKSIADAVLASERLVVDGILTEPCEASAGCDYNAQAFKGIFTRYLAELDGVLRKTRPYREFIRGNAEAAYGRDRNGTGFYGVRWAGPFEEEVTIATQASAASLMLAALEL
ncbi:putative glycosyl hydrolase [Coniochaeta sp. 2T2.1]|nr:putative glycosyl hydrolase [Coniochaeta sp. 2T2.1]